MGNREAWLEEAVWEASTLLYERAGIEVPRVRVAVGWPSKRGTSLKKRTVGECWKPEVAEDGISQIFISPVMDAPVQVLGTLIHELIHAWDECEHGHRGPFVRAAKAVGLTGPWTATSVGEDLQPVLESIAEQLGPYPHSKLTPQVQRKVQTTRQLKIECPDCGCIARMTQKWINVGLPTCYCGTEMEAADA